MEMFAWSSFFVTTSHYLVPTASKGAGKVAKEAGRKRGFVSNSSFIHFNQTAGHRAKKLRVKALCRAGWCLTSWVVVGVELMVVAGVVHNSAHPEAAQ